MSSVFPVFTEKRFFTDDCGTTIRPMYLGTFVRQPQEAACRRTARQTGWRYHTKTERNRKNGDRPGGAAGKSPAFPRRLPPALFFSVGRILFSLLLSYYILLFYYLLFSYLFYSTLFFSSLRHNVRWKRHNVTYINPFVTQRQIMIAVSIIFP